MIVLTPKYDSDIPIEAECISPNTLTGKSVSEMEEIEVFKGNQRIELGEVFDIEKESDQEKIVIKGNVDKIKRIGEEMESGEIVIEGNAGMHLGRRMSGGKIACHGDVPDYVAENMTGGLIEIKGDAGDRLGSAEPGEEIGMKGGTIIVRGSVGTETGRRMRRGLIAVYGDVGSFAGTMMDGGSIISFGNFDDRLGAGMDRGSIIAFNEPELLPTFKYNCTYRPNFLRMILAELKKYDLPIEDKHIDGRYSRYSGDLAALGKGEILVWEGE